MKNCFSGHKRKVYFAQFSHDDRFIYSGGNDSKIIKWKVDTLKKVYEINLNGYLESIIVSADEKYLISGDFDGNL